MSERPYSNVRTVATAVARDGYCIAPGFLAPAVLESLARQSARLWRAGNFRHARVGAGEERQLRPDIRGDHVLWLDEAEVTGAQRQWRERIERLRTAVNRETFAGLFDWEGHLAVYPSGSLYRRHLDRHRGDASRRLSTILYLNPVWNPGDGGELRLWLDDEGVGEFIDVPPVGGTFVVFDSHRFWHEVRRSHFERHSITGWFRVRS